MTKTPFALALAALAAACGAPQPSALKDEFSGSAFFYLDHLDRAQVVRELGAEVEGKYALLPVKRARLGIDAAALFAAAAAEELASPDATEPFEQARGNLAYLDRVKRLVATFQDSHFSARALNRAPDLLTGVTLAEAGGKIVVARIRPALLALTPAAAAIAPGDEVAAIDGAPVEAAVAALLPYVNGSSPATRRYTAVDSLLGRGFRYPDAGTVTLAVVHRADGRSETVTLPWYFDDAYKRQDAAFYLSKLGIAGGRAAAGEDYAKREGYDPYGSAAGLTDAALWTDGDDATWPVLRTGYVARAGKTFGVLQLMTYDIESVARDGVKTELMAPVRAFLKEVKAKGTPLIVDLRFNGGGDGNTPAKILAALTPAGVAYPDRTSSFRVTRTTRQMVEAWSGVATGPQRRAADALRAAIAGHAAMSDEFSQTEGVTADPDVGGFDAPVVALIGPRCGSACDIQAMLFRASGRVTLLGQPTNGTGAGYRTSTPYDSTEIRDGFDVFKFNVPNFLFGRPLGVGAQVYRAEPRGFSANSENQPTAPDVAYQATVDDLVGHDAGWYERAAELLSR